MREKAPHLPLVRIVREVLRRVKARITGVVGSLLAKVVLIVKMKVSTFAIDGSLHVAVCVVFVFVVRHTV
jgi:hypothetical protein